MSRPIAAPKKTFFDEEMSTTRLWRAPASRTPNQNPRVEPPLIFTPFLQRSSKTPTSQNVFLGQSAKSVPSPSIR